MPDQEYDSLEQFFRKASTKADVAFDEEDWKKLEARLDAAAAATSQRKGTRMATAVVVGALMLLSTALWLNYHFGVRDVPTTDVATNEVIAAPETVDRGATRPVRPESTNQLPADVKDIEEASIARRSRVKPERTVRPVDDSELPPITMKESERLKGEEAYSQAVLPNEATQSESEKPDDDMERNKQKAVVQLPGAEEEETREAVQEEHASGKKEHVATPRLSLLLSFAPDFSGTSMELYSSPGKAVGAMLSYHPFDRWSISAGVVKNTKLYTGAGEDYQPPRNYWKYYTNGVVPESIDGSCSILEFPVMIQYTAFEGRKSRWNAGVGTSSYIMQSESYNYSFAQPNPGAKEGWHSDKESRFYFNMLNFTVGYERQIFPGLMVGVEPYAKIPLQEIGWSNLKLFSSGVSFTLRYTVVRKKSTVFAVDLGPD